MCLQGEICSLFAQVWSSELVEYQGDKLTYTKVGEGDCLPGFSCVGYKHGSKIPEVMATDTIEPTGTDDTKYIQGKINALANLPINKNGFRGALYFRKGVYKVDSTIYIKNTGIVLTGETMNNKPMAKIIATGSSKRSLFHISGTGGIEEIPGTRVPVTQAHVPVGAYNITVDSANTFEAGDQVILFRPGTKKWIADIGMDNIPQRKEEGKVIQWKPADYNLHYERIITKVHADTIFFKNPVVIALSQSYGGGAVYKYNFKGRINNVGLQHLLLESEYQSENDEQHAWTAIEFDKCENAWVHNITASHFAYSTVWIKRNAKNVTVSNCTSIDPISQVKGGRRYPFHCQGQLSLFINCVSFNGRHDFITGSRVCGPNAYVNCTAINSFDESGPHHRWATGVLWDNISTDNEINIENRLNRGSGHGWTAINNILWNCAARSASVQSPQVSGNNFNIGFTGVRMHGKFSPESPDGYWEGNNKPGLQPKSLYFAQLQQHSQIPFFVYQRVSKNKNNAYKLSFTKGVNTTLLTNTNITYQQKNKQPQVIDSLKVLPGGNHLLVSIPDNEAIETNTFIEFTLSGITDTNNMVLQNNKAYYVPIKKPPEIYQITKVDKNIIIEASANTVKIFMVNNKAGINSQFALEQAVLNKHGKSFIYATPRISIEAAEAGKNNNRLFAIDKWGNVSTGVEL